MSYGRISIVARRAFPATSIIIPQLSPLVNYKFAFLEKTEKIILNAKGSESLPTHYFFT